MRRPRFRKGDWRAQDERSGFPTNASDLVEQWDGRMVPRDDVDPRHPQDYLKGIPDYQAVPWSRPPQEDTTTKTWGIGYWMIGNTVRVRPDSVPDYDTDPVAFNIWLGS